MTTPFDAVLLLSFGGPEGPDDVMPFLRNVVRGRGVPDERLAVVAEHYHHFGGVSPINDQCRSFKAALEQALAERGPALPVYWGNRNWHPMLADAVQQMVADGVQHAAVVATSAFGSYSGCRRYREDLAGVDVEGAPQMTKLRPYADTEGFRTAQQARIDEALAQAPDARLVFTAHSIPTASAAGAPYEQQLRAVAASLAGDREWELVWQSRSGPPQVPWLEPDILDHLEATKDDPRPVVAVPLGFLSDHMEVVWDLDTEAADKAEELGIRWIRAGTVGDHPAFVEQIRQLIEDADQRERWPQFEGCYEGCCPKPQRPKRPSGRPGGAGGRPGGRPS
jgi:ferrochelatase